MKASLVAIAAVTSLSLFVGLFLAFNALLLAIGPISDAQARSRETTVTTPRGTSTRQTNADCANGSCTRNRQVTGPNGNTATKSGTISKTGDGSASFNSTTTGPQGGSIQRSGTVTTTPAQ